MLTPMPISIRSRLLLLVLSVLLPAAVAAGWLISQAYAADREALERSLRDTTHTLSSLVDRELVQRAAIARVLAVSTTLEQPGPLTIDKLAAFEQQARRALHGLNGWVELASADTTLVDTRLPPAAAQRPRAADSPPLADEAIVRALQPGGEGGQLHAAVVQPVQRDGQTVLNVIVTILPDELQRIVAVQVLPQGWVGSVVDRRGAVVALHPGGGGLAGRVTTTDLRQLLTQKKEGLFDTVVLDGDPSAGYFSTSPQGWTTITAMPRTQFAGALPSVAGQLAGGALVLLTVAVLSALWLARRIEMPVNALQQSARRLQAGLAVERTSTGISEFDAVAGALADAGDAVHRNQAELERQVAEAVATARAAEQHVSRSQRTEALSRLTGGVAHDFNNLLGVISNSAHLIQHHPSADDLRVPLSAVLRSVEAGSRLTQHLVRIAGRHPARPGLLDLRHFLPDVQELMKLVLGKRVELTVNVAPDTLKVTVDASELELALISLALNSRDAMSPNGPGGHVWLSAGNASAEDCAGMRDGDFVLITVSDDGKGIAEDIVERVFEPFFTTKGVGQGTGLGMAQVQGFCAQAGGRARLASTSGVGTSVMLLLPAGTSSAAPHGARRDAMPPAVPVAEERLQGARVLMVEDNEELANVTSALLASYGCVVESARSPGQALRLIAAGQDFDVVLSDVVMPGDMDGLQLAHELRANHPALPVVLISGYSSALYAVHDFTMLHKPCTPEQLTTALADAMAVDAIPSSRQPGDQAQA